MYASYEYGSRKQNYIGNIIGDFAENEFSRLGFRFWQKNVLSDPVAPLTIITMLAGPCLYVAKVYNPRRRASRVERRIERIGR